MHRVSFWSISECINLFFIVVFDFLNCPQCEKMDLKITVTAGKGSDIQKMPDN